MKRSILFTCCLYCLQTIFAITGKYHATVIAQDFNDYIAECYPELLGDCFWLVDTKTQHLYKIDEGAISDAYVISSGKNGEGCLLDSYKTPIGLHIIAEKIGGGLPKGTIFISRKATKRLATIYTDSTDTSEDFVTTRILWLQGMELGINKGGLVDTKERCIYIHGTPEEGLLGKKVSHGCIRVSNDAVIELNELMDIGDRVLILPEDR